MWAVFFREGEEVRWLILVAEAHPVTREGLSQIIGANLDMAAVPRASNTEEVLHEIAENHYDLIILGVSVPGRSWLDLLKDLRAQTPDLPVVILSPQVSEDDARRAFRAGASGYLTTDRPPGEIITALRRVLTGGKYVVAPVTETLAAGLEPGAGKALHESLSDREYQVMGLLASGKTISEIAEEMSLSVKTISTYRSHLLEKLNLKNNVELSRYYMRSIEARTVRCKGCGQDNPYIAKFCAQCGAVLDTVARPFPEASRPPASPPETRSRYFGLLKNHRWLALTVVVVAIVTGVIVWRMQPASPSVLTGANLENPDMKVAPVVPTAVELRHDDGKQEVSIHSDYGGYLVHFLPASFPFVVNKIRIYGATLPSEKTQFEVQIWDEGQNVLYSASRPLTVFPAVATVEESRDRSRWIDLTVPDIEVRTGFFAHVFAASSYGRGILIGVDDSTRNTHSNLTDLTSGGTYKIRDGWGKYQPDAWWAEKGNVNWMIRVVGRSR